MRSRKDFRAYQNGAIDFVKENKRAALFIDPGLGKTISVITAITDLIDDFECGMTLVVAPPRVAQKTWPDEFGEWAHAANRSFVHITGTLKKRRQLLKRKADFHIISVELLPWLLNELGGHSPDRRKIKRMLSEDPVEVLKEFGGLTQDQIDWLDDEKILKKVENLAKAENRWRAPTRVPYTAIVVDESSKLKEQGTNRWKALRTMAFRVERFIIMTGTAAPNGYQDLWAQIYLLDGGTRLGHTITAFRERWCRENYNGHGYTVEKYATKIIEERLADICFTLREEDYASLPPRMYNTIEIEFDAETHKKYKKFERTYILELPDDEKVLVRNGAAITNKLQQLANGVVYDAERKEHDFHTLKLDALQDLVNELNGQPLLVAYSHVSDTKRILKRFKGAKMLGKDPKVQDAWNAGEIPMLLVHPNSAAHGLNLQFGGCHAVWYGLTWSLENYIQLNKRLHRSGQTRPVMIHHLIVKGTIDEDAMKAINGKNDMQEALLTALKKRIRSYK